MDTAAGSSRFDCCLIGDNALVASCGEILLEHGSRIVGVISPSSAVQQWAAKHGLPWAEPTEGGQPFLERTPFDYLFSIVNHRLLTAEVCSLPRRLAINFHDSLLPRYAGIHATAWAVLNEEREHGVSWHVMTRLTDAGAILQSRRVELDPLETSRSLNLKCYDAALSSFRELIPSLAAGTCRQQTQSPALRTYYPRHRKPATAGVIAWDASAQAIDALVRACDFGAHENTFCSAKLLLGDRCWLVRKSRVLAGSSGRAPGTVLACSAQGIRVATRDHDLLLCELTDGDGRPVPPAELLEQEELAVGAPLPSIDPAESARALDVLERAYRHEAQWVGRLARCTAPGIVVQRMRSSREAGGRQLCIIELPETMQVRLVQQPEQDWRDGVSAAFGAFLCRVSGTRCAWLGMRAEDAAGDSFVSALLSRYVPVEMSVGDEHASVEEVFRHLAGVVAEARYGPACLFDVRARYPVLQKDETTGARLPIVVEYVDSIDPNELQLRCSGDEHVVLAMLIGSDRSKVAWQYDSARLEKEDVARWAEQFTSFMTDASARPGARLAELSLLSDRSRRSVLSEWNQTARPYPHTRCIHDLIDEQAARTPGAVAYSFRNEALTYGELQRQSAALAARLAAAGIAGGQFVGVFMRRSLQMPVALLGILKSGAAYIPLDPTHPANRLALMIRDSRLTALLVDEDSSEALPPCEVPVFRINGAQAVTDPPDRVAEGCVAGKAGPDDVAYMLYTSGSTGVPKGVPIRHRSLTNLFASMQEMPGIDARDRILGLTTISFDIACAELLLPLICGGSVEILSAEVISDGAQLLRALEASPATVVQATPATWRMLLAAGWQTRRPIRVWCAGEALVPQLAQALLERCTELWNCYGPTETAIYACFYKVDDPQAIAIGRPVANTQLYILDEDRNPVPVGTAGELYIGGVGLSPGYHQRAELNERSFLPNPFGTPGSRLYRTGDACRFRTDGCVEYLGRLDHQVKVRGFRIELGEIESVLLRHGTVRDAAVQVHDDEQGNRRLVAYVVPGEELPTAQRLRGFLQEHLPTYMIPASFVYLARLPVSPNGKVDRKALHLAAPLIRDAPPAQAEISLEEQRVLGLWREVLVGAQIGLHDNFFEVGGDSILLAQLAQRLGREYGRAVSNVELFSHPTVASFARYITGRSTELEQVRVAGSAELAGRTARQTERLRRKQAIRRER